MSIVSPRRSSGFFSDEALTQCADGRKPILTARRPVCSHGAPESDARAQCQSAEVLFAHSRASTHLHFLFLGAAQHGPSAGNCLRVREKGRKFCNLSNQSRPHTLLWCNPGGEHEVWRPGLVYRFDSAGPVLRAARAGICHHAAQRRGELIGRRNGG